MSLFDKIAPIYGLFFNFQVNYFNKILKRADHEIDISKYENILDIGCGTGAFCKVLYEKGLDVVGVDPSQGMLNQAEKKLKALPINLKKIVPGETFPFEDDTFDIVFISYVAHGLDPDERIELYEEMKRISREIVIIHDYNKVRGWLTTVIEWLERGDYFNFIKIAKEEMLGVFGKIKEINVDTRASWYICYCDKLR